MDRFLCTLTNFITIIGEGTSSEPKILIELISIIYFTHAIKVCSRIMGVSGRTLRYPRSVAPTRTTMSIEFDRFIAKPHKVDVKEAHDYHFTH